MVMVQQVTSEALSKIQLFRHLSQDEMSFLANYAKKVAYKKNSEIYLMGIKPEYVYIVEKGSIKLSVSSTNGKALTKEIVYHQDIFSENIFSQHPLTQEDAEAMTDTILYAIPVEAFRQLAIKNAFFANQVMTIILSKLQNIESRLQSYVFRKAKERIVDYLYRTGMRQGIKIGINECLISHGITHKEIAFLTDTSRQTVARIMNELKRDNLIHYGSRKNSKILIRNLVSLQHYTE